MNTIFENLFVLELANNHYGNINRGKKIIEEFSKIIKEYKIKAAIKLQFRDVDNFIHKDFLSSDERYINKTLKTKLTFLEFQELISYIKILGCMPMATPFDEKSVKWCVDLELEIIKIASSDINDWILLNAIAKTKKPVIVSTGGASENEIDNVVKFFNKRNIPLALNHCVSKYPSEDYELELDQIDYLKNRYPNITIGLSTHEYHDWQSSMLISYAKGVRTWERHIDLDLGDYPISKYCSTPDKIEIWFNAYNKAKEMCGGVVETRRVIDDTEKNYLYKLYRGLYFKKDMKKGSIIKLDDLYSAVPYQKEKKHITTREYIDNIFILKYDVKKDEPLLKTQLK